MSKWSAIVTQILDVEQYGVERFLTENPLKTANASVLYIVKKNMNWRCSICGSAITRVQSIEMKIKGMYSAFMKDIQIISPIAWLNAMKEILTLNLW